MADSYAHPELLAETRWLAQHLGEAGIRIVDCEDRSAYHRAHIPGAVVLPNNRLKTRGSDTEPISAEEMKELAESLGISDSTMVVVYDGARGVLAARFWWALQLYGHQNVRLLNGGWKKWLREGRPISVTEASYPRGSFTPRLRPELLATVDEVKGRIGRSDVALWDVRTAREFTGEEPRNNQRPGHMPGAVQLEWLEAVDPDTGEVKPPEVLRHMLKQKGITPEKEVVTY